jgi:hypothetical protein
MGHRHPLAVGGGHLVSREGDDNMTIMLPRTETNEREIGARVSGVMAAAAAAVPLVSRGAGGQIVAKLRLLAGARKSEDKHLGGRVARASAVKILWARLARPSPAL